MFLSAALALTSQTVGQTLLFKSGFDANSTVVDSSGNPPAPSALSDGVQIEGLDNVSGYNWGPTNSDIPGNGNFHFNLDTTGNGAWATISNDPTNKNRGKVFDFWLEYPSSVKGRVQARVAGFEYDEITNIRKMYVHPDLATLKTLSGTLGYFIIEEMWTNPVFDGGEDPNFRINLQIEKQTGSGQPLHWKLNASYTNGGGSVWGANTISQGIWVDDVFGQWVTLVTYYKKGNASTGRLKVKLIKENGTEQQLFDVTGWTMHETDPSQQTGVTQQQVTKVYSPKATVDHMRNNSPGGGFKVYWDDWEYWQGDKYTNFMPGPFSLAATAVSSSQINLAWSNIPNETGFTIQRATNATFTAGLTTSTVGANVLAFNSTGLSASTTYYYRVRGTNAGGNSEWSPVASAMTQAGGTTVTFASIGSEDGRVSESSESSGVGGTPTSTGSLELGDFTQDRQVKSIVSFDTSSLPDGATITSATLRLRRKSLQNLNPFTWGGECRVDIRNGAFNGNAALEAADFQVAASATNVTQMSSPSSDGDWSTGALSSTGRSNINKTGKTQLRVYFATDDNDNDQGDKMLFYSGEDATGSKPELVIVYQ